MNSQLDQNNPTGVSNEFSYYDLTEAKKAQITHVQRQAATLLSKDSIQSILDKNNWSLKSSILTGKMVLDI